MIKILILGGGFGGVRAALNLEKKLRNRGDIKITLIDKNDCHIFTPALYEVASVYGVDHEHPYHTKLRGVVSIAFSQIFKGKKVEIVQAEVNHIDINSKHIVTNNGATIDFDYLILAFGSKTSTFGIPGIEEYAFKFKTIEDGLILSDKLEELYIKASQTKHSLPINIFIGGAGFNGIELAAELSNCTVHIAHRHAITQQSCTSITLIEAGPVILPMISKKERGLISRRLKKLGINIMVNSTIEEVGPDYIKLKNGNVLKGDLIIWSGGVKALDIFKSVVGLELNDRGQILVNEFLQVKNHNEIFAIGDNIVFIDQKTQKPISQMAYLAIKQGRVATDNILRLIDHSGHKMRKYSPQFNLWIAPIGGKYAFAHLYGLNFSGFMGYILRELTGFRYFLSILPFFEALKIFFEGVKVFSKNN